MANKNECLDMLQAQIEAWKCEMKSFEEIAAGASEEVKAKYCGAMNELRCKAEEGEATLEQWKATAEDAWESLQEEAEKTFATFSASMADSMRRIKSLFS